MPIFASTAPSSRPQDTASRMHDTTIAIGHSFPIYAADLDNRAFPSSSPIQHRVPPREHRNTMASQAVSLPLPRLDRRIPDPFESQQQQQQQLNQIQRLSGQSASYHLHPHTHYHQTHHNQPIDTRDLDQNTTDSLGVHQQQAALAHSATYWNGESIHYLLDAAATTSAPPSGYAPVSAPPRSLWTEELSAPIPTRAIDPLYSPSPSAEAHQSQSQPLSAHESHDNYDMISSPPNAGPYQQQDPYYHHHQGRDVILGGGSVGVDLSRQPSDQPYYSVYHDGLPTAPMSPSPIEHYASHHLSMLSPDHSAAADSHEEGATVPKGAIAGSKSSTGINTMSKDEEPYAKTLYRALMEAPGHSMALRRIYRWFEENTEKPKSGNQGWQNSIRHNLSMNQAFVRREHGGGSEPGQLKKNAVWALEPWAVENGIQSTTRYRVKHLPGASSGRQPAGVNAARQTALQHNKAASGRKGGCATNKVKRQRRLQQQFGAHNRYQPFSQPSEYSGSSNYISALTASPDQYYAPAGMIPGQASSPMLRESYDAGAMLPGNRFSEVKQEDYQAISPLTPPAEYHDAPKAFDYRDVSGVYEGDSCLVETEAEFMSATAQGGPKHEF